MQCCYECGEFILNGKCRNCGEDRLDLEAIICKNVDVCRTNVQLMLKSEKDSNSETRTYTARMEIDNEIKEMIRNTNALVTKGTEIFSDFFLSLLGGANSTWKETLFFKSYSYKDDKKKEVKIPLEVGLFFSWFGYEKFSGNCRQSKTSKKYNFEDFTPNNFIVPLSIDVIRKYKLYLSECKMEQKVDDTILELIRNNDMRTDGAKWVDRRAAYKKLQEIFSSNDIEKLAKAFVEHSEFPIKNHDKKEVSCNKFTRKCISFMNETDQKCDRKRLLKIMKFSLNVIEKNDGVNRLAVIKMLTDEFGFKLTTEDLQLEQNHKKLKQFLSGTPNAIKGAESIFYKFLIGESRRSKEKFVKKLKEEIRKYECDDELISSIKIMQSLNIYNHFNYKNECLKSAIANISKTRKASFNQYVERKKLEEKLKTVEEVVDKEVNRELINAVNHFKSEECRKIAIREKQEGRMPSNEYYLTTKQISNADTFFEYVQKFDTRNEALIEFKKKVTHGDINLYEFLIHNYFKLCKEIGKIEKSVYEQLGNLVKLDGCERNLRNLKHPIYRHYDINTCPAILWFVGNSGIGGEIIPEYNDYNLVTAGASNRLKKKIRRKECGERLFKVKFELFNKSINEFEWRSIICHGLRIDVEILQGLRNDLKNLELSPRNHPLCINDGNQYVRTDCSTISFNIDSNNYEKLNIAVTLNCKKPKDIKESDGFKVCSIDQGLRMPIAYAITEVSKSKCKESISLMGHNGEESGYYIKVNNVGEMKIPGYPDENILRPGKNLIFVTNEQRKILTDIIACQKEINKNFSDENQYNNFNKEIPRRDNLLDFQLDVVKSFRRLTWSLPPLLKNKKNKKEIKPYYEKVKSIYEKVGYLILGEKFCFYEKKNMSEKIIKINQELSSRKSRSNGNLSDKRIEILFTLLKGMKSLVAKCKLNDEEHAWFPIHGICGNIDKLQEKHTNVRRDRANKSGNGCMKLVKNNKCTMIVCEDLSNLIPSRSQSKGFNVRLSNWLKQRICTTIKNQSSLSGILMKKVIARNTSLIDWTQEAEGLSKPDTHRRINLITKEELSNKKDEYIRSFNYCLKGNSSVAKALKWFCDENDVKTGTRIVEKLLSCNHDWMEGNKIIIPHKSGEYYFRAKFCGAKKLPFSNKEGWKIINSDYSGAMTIGVRGIRNALGLKKREGICLVDE